MSTATPSGRDRALDAYRAVAIAGVVAGHWLVGALVLGPDGALVITSPLRTIEAVAATSWFLQMLGLATVLTRLAVAAARQLGGWEALLLATVVAVGDLLRYGPWHDVVPRWPGPAASSDLGAAWPQRVLLGVLVAGFVGWAVALY